MEQLFIWILILFFINIVGRRLSRFSKNKTKNNKTIVIMMTILAVVSIIFIITELIYLKY